MKALSIMQPWAWLIVNGHKAIENRTWRCHVRGQILIHAGKKLDRSPYDDLNAFRHPVTGDQLPPPIDPPFEYEFGGIVGEAEIVDCVGASADPWFCGPFGIVLRNARPLPFRPCRGMLGFFTPDFTPAAPKPAAPPRQGSLLP